MTRRFASVLAALVCALSVLLVLPAQAASPTVTLGQAGPSPASLTVATGDTVTFSNTDQVDHALAHTSTNWTFTATVKVGKKAVTPKFTKAGTYQYRDDYTNLLGLPATQFGTITVTTAPTPSPTPSKIATPKPSASAAASSKPSTGATTTVPTPTSTGGTGSAQLPPIIPGGPIPTMQPTESTGPAPQVAPGATLPGAEGEQGGPTSSPSAAAGGGTSYSGKSGLVQSSRHGYGLPAALAVVAIVGVVTLIVRLLLAQPEAARPQV